MISRKKLGGFVAILMLLVASVYFYHSTICYPPSHIHAWTQSDRYAIAIGFTENGLNLFKPQTYNLQTKEGVTAVDFPLPDYLAAIGMKISSSRQPVIFRLTVLLLCASLLLLFIRFVVLYSQSAAKGVGMGLFVFSLPIIVYYQAGFIPSPVALYLCLGGMYMYWQYLTTHRFTYLASALGMFALAALIRTPFSLFLAGLIGAQLIYSLRYKVLDARQPLAYVLAVGAVLLYYGYNHYLRAEYGSLFISRFMPAHNWQHLTKLGVLVWQRWHYQYLSLAHYIFVAVVLTGFVLGYLRRQIHLSRQQRQMGVTAGIFTLTALCYFPLMARQFVDHEYYFIDSLYLPTIIIIALLWGSTRYGIANLPMAALCAGLLCIGCYQSKQVQQTKYSYADWDMGEVTRKNFTGADVFLDSLGVARTAKLLVIDAYTFNYPLLLAGRKGYTVLSTYYANIDTALALPYDYIVIQDRSILSDVLNYYPPFGNRAKRIAGNGRVSVFVRDSAGHNDMWQLSGMDKHSIIDSSTAIMGTSKDKDDSGYVYHIMPEHKYSPSYEARYDGSYNAILFKTCFTGGAKTQVSVALQIQGPNGYNYYKGQSIAIMQQTQGLPQQLLLKLPDNAPEGSVIKCFIVNDLNQYFAYKEAIIYLLKQ